MAVTSAHVADSIGPELPSVEPEIDVVDLDTLPTRERRIVMEYANGDHDSISSIAKALCEDRERVRRVLFKHFDSRELPYGKSGNKTTAERSFPDLTDTQQQLVDFYALNWPVSGTRAAEEVGCSAPYAYHTRDQYWHLIEERRRELNPSSVVREELLDIRDRIDELLVEIA